MTVSLTRNRLCAPERCTPAAVRPGALWGWVADMGRLLPEWAGRARVYGCAGGRGGRAVGREGPVGRRPAGPARQERGATAARDHGPVSGTPGRSAPVRRPAARLAALVRRRGRSAVSRALRMTAATVAAFVVAEVGGLHSPPPLIAALTALLVVQATLSSTLVNGAQRVVSVVSGVALAVLFVAVVGLTWWSLAALVAVSILVGQLLRLGPHLVEVPISAMLVLGVGASGAESVGGGRILETLIGAGVGMLVNV